jgi:hypothetical protein
MCCGLDARGSAGRRLTCLHKHQQRLTASTLRCSQPPQRLSRPDAACIPALQISAGPGGLSKASLQIAVHQDLGMVAWNLTRPHMQAVTQGTNFEPRAWTGGGGGGAATPTRPGQWVPCHMPKD